MRHHEVSLERMRKDVQLCIYADDGEGKWGRKNVCSGKGKEFWRREGGLLSLVDLPTQWDTLVTGIGALVERERNSIDATSSKTQSLRPTAPLVKAVHDTCAGSNHYKGENGENEKKLANIWQVSSHLAFWRQNSQIRVSYMQSASQRSYFWDALPSDLHWMSYFYINDTCLFGNMDPDILKLISLCGTLKLPVCAFLKCNMHFEIFKWPKLRLQLSFKNLTSGWLYSNNCHFFLPKNYTLFSKIVAEFLTALFWMIFCNYSQHLSTWWPSFFALVHFCMFLQKLKKICKECQHIGISCPQMSIEPKPDFASPAFAVLQYAFRGGREVLVEVGRIILWVGEFNLKWVEWCSFWHKEISGLRKQSGGSRLRWINAAPTISLCGPCHILVLF